MKSNNDLKIEFVDDLPIINLSNKLLILNTAKKDLKYDWLNFIEFLITNEMRNKKAFQKNKVIQDYKYGSRDFLNFPKSLKQLFGFDEGMKVLQFIFNSGIYTVKLTATFDKLMNYYNNNDRQVTGSTLTPKGVIGRFFMYLWMKEKVLLPTYGGNLGKLKMDFEPYMVDINFYGDIVKMIKEELSEKMEIQNLNLFSFVIMSTKWNCTQDINNEDITLYQKYCFEHTEFEPLLRRRNTLLNILRKLLILGGRKDISTPQEYVKTIKNNPQKEHYDMNNPIGWLSIDETSKLYRIKVDALEFLEQLRLGGMQKKTTKKYLVSINHLLRYIVQLEDTFEDLNAVWIESLYDPASSTNLYNHLKQINEKEKSAAENMSYISKFLEFSGLLTEFSRKYRPKIKAKKRKTTSRNAMSLDMLNHLKDIIDTRPPRSGTNWNPSKADLGWWKHKNIYPVFPIMLMMHLRIPIRGGQLRHLCRINSLVFNEITGELDRFIINTDKNVNREFLHEIPNVWEELNILGNYLKWHKEYYPSLPRYKYNDDDNTPWEDIEPLFLIPGSLNPITFYQYKVYFTKLICIYQIEMDQMFEKKEVKYKVQVAKKKDGSEFYKDRSEIDFIPDTNLIRDVEIVYDIHSIRVSGITRYLEMGVNLYVIQMLTGHVDLNMIVSVYTKFTHNEKKEILRTAVNQIDFSEEDDFLLNVESFIYDEIPNNYDMTSSKGVKKAFKDNGLFSLSRNSYSGNSIKIDVELGTDIAIDRHPSLWTPMVHGICPATTCLEGRDRKCSLCPYFITGRLFIKGIKHMANLAMTSFYRLSKEFEEDKQVSSRFGDSKSSIMELKMEEILGWHEILDKIDRDINGIDDTNYLPAVLNSNNIGLEEKPIELAYLENCYSAKRMGVEQDHYGLKVLTIRAIKLASKMRESEKIDQLISDEIYAVDYLMGYYNEYRSNNLLPEFIKELTS